MSVTFGTCLLRLISTMVGEKDFYEQQKSFFRGEDGVTISKRLEGFTTGQVITLDFAFPKFRNSRKNTCVIEKIAANSKFAF